MQCKQNEEFVYQAVQNGDLEILPDGTIWRVRKRGWDRWKQQAVSRPCRRVRAEHAVGEYQQVRIMVDRVRIYALAHRLVYRHFSGPIPAGLTVNHENGQKTDNRPENLTLATYSEQQLHALYVLQKGRVLDQNGERNAMAKLTSQQVAEIRRRRSQGERLLRIAQDFGIAFQTVSKIAQGSRWRNAPISG